MILHLRIRYIITVPLQSICMYPHMYLVAYYMMRNCQSVFKMHFNKWQKNVFYKENKSMRSVASNSFVRIDDNFFDISIYLII